MCSYCCCSQPGLSASELVAGAVDRTADTRAGEARAPDRAQRHGGQACQALRARHCGQGGQGAEERLSGPAARGAHIHSSVECALQAAARLRVLHGDGRDESAVHEGRVWRRGALAARLLGPTVLVRQGDCGHWRDTTRCAHFRRSDASAHAAAIRSSPRQSHVSPRLHVRSRHVEDRAGRGRVSREHGALQVVRALLSRGRMRPRAQNLCQVLARLAHNYPQVMGQVRIE